MPTMVGMGRPRSFDEHAVLAAATTAFTDLGYEATSVDDLLRATGLHRGSLYQAFGSKRGLFLAALRAHLPDPADPSGSARPGATAHRPSSGAADADDVVLLDLLLVAVLELAPRDDQVRALITRALADHGAPDAAALLLGRRLLARAHIDPAQPSREDPAP